MALLIKDKSEIKTANTFTSVNPATLELLGEIDVFNKERVDLRVSKAHDAFSIWSKIPLEERLIYISKARDYIMDNLDNLCELITKENGKPLVESISADILPVLDLMDYYIKNKNAIPSHENISLGKWSLLNKSSYIEYVPLGVIAIISPWNFPFSIPMGQIIQAIITGNTVVLKPSEHTPLIALEMANIFNKIGLPDGVFNVVTGLGETGSNLVSARVNKIVFTGSVATGKKIMAAAAQNLTPVVLELGGKDPMIVLKDVNMSNASSGAVWGAFTNSGQVCASVERMYVDESIADEFIYEVVRKTKKLRQGIGLDKNTDIGPMISLAQMNIVKDHVQDARDRGAKILTGGEQFNDLAGYFYKPTILTNVNHDFKIVSEETFGPVLPIMTFKSEEEVIKMANDSKYALTASIWTTDIERAKNMANQIEAGTVSINDCVSTFALCQTPWGGGKESGIGRTHGKFGIMEFVEPKHIHVDKNYNMKKFWWYGYDENRLDLMKQSLKLLFTNGGVTALPQLIKDLMKNKPL
ncbi:MAG: aldehyde dehydrogenase family protein [Candidatus Sericytochromatia bacterium]|nr:aldehyde dehydrogenase family protein [Candidatus Sericytochromatia bacterium]